MLRRLLTRDLDEYRALPARRQRAVWRECLLAARQRGGRRRILLYGVPLAATVLAAILRIGRRSDEWMLVAMLLVAGSFVVAVAASEARAVRRKLRCRLGDPLDERRSE